MGPCVGKIKIEFCIACSRGHSTGHLDAKIRCLAHFLTEFSRILSFKTYKKLISPYVEVCELNSKRACCIRLSASIGHIYIFNVYMPCDSSINSNLEEYNEVLSVISYFCATHNVENCVIGGDLNTDMSHTKSGNSINLFLVNQ